MLRRGGVVLRRGGVVAAVCCCLLQVCVTQTLWLQRMRRTRAARCRGCESPRLSVSVCVLFGALSLQILHC